MADQLFNESPAVGSSGEIPDIFDVLEGGEDEGAVRFLLGFNGEEGSVGFLGQVDTFGGMEVMEKYVGDGLNIGLTGSYLPSPLTTTAAPPVAATTTTITAPSSQQQQPENNSPSTFTQIKSPVAVRQAHSSLPSKKRDTSGTKAIHNCDSCGKCFTTKFNLKRHINMHCHKSKENGVPIQGPPSASAPAKKNDKILKSENHVPTTGLTAAIHASDGIQLVNPQTVLPQQQGQPQPQQQHQPVIQSQIALAHQTVQQPVITLASNNNNNSSSNNNNNLTPMEYPRPEPDSTYKLPSVQTLLPVSTGYSATNTFTNISCDSSQVVSNSSSVNVSSSGSNTDYGTLPADLFDPDSSRSESQTPTSPKQMSWGDTREEGRPPSPPRVTLTSIPAGWTRKVCLEAGKLRNKFCSPLGKIFSSHEEIDQYFKTFNYTVPVGLFNFDAHYDDDEDSEEEEEEEEEEDEEEEEEEDDEELEESEEEEEEEEDYDCESSCAKRMKSEVQVFGSEALSPPPRTATAATPSPQPSPLSSPIANLGCTPTAKQRKGLIACNKLRVYGAKVQN